MALLRILFTIEIKYLLYLLPSGHSLYFICMVYKIRLEQRQLLYKVQINYNSTTETYNISSAIARAIWFY